MINKIYPKQFHHVDSITLNGITAKSSYNHNYYMNDKNEIILEVSDDDGFYSYQSVTELNERFVDYHNDGNPERCIDAIGDDLGNHSGRSIFKEDYLDEDGSIEIDTDFC